MKLKFKHQKFQADASKAVVDVFSGQPHLSSSYMIDRGYEAPKENSSGQISLAFIEENKKQIQKRKSIKF